MIQIRRHPLLSILLPALGLIGGGWGLYMENAWLIVPGILLLLLGALQMLNPVANIEPDKVQLKNIFGMVRAEYGHDGIALMELRGDKLFIRKGQQIAHLHQLNPKRLHPADWSHLGEAIQKARELKDNLGQ
ncbi:MAG: hypothetical protein AAGN35_00820 [Bacteroidota bacterium]